jgi:hypothetical protein
MNKSPILQKLVAVLLLCPGLMFAAAGDCPDEDSTQFICDIPSAEDLIRIGDSDLVLAGGMGRPDWSYGGFRIVDVNTRAHYEPAPDYDSKVDQLYEACPGAPDADKFSVHGLSLRAEGDGDYTVFAVNHGGRESIEVFDMKVIDNKPALTWKGCVILPDNLAANSVTYLPDERLAATANPQRTEVLEGELGERAIEGSLIGGVFEWGKTLGWNLVPGSEIVIANGILASNDGEWLYLVGWADGVVRKINRYKPETEKVETKMDFLVDNLRYTPSGRILATGQRTTPGRLLEECVLTEVPVCGVDSVVADLDPDLMLHEEIVDLPGTVEFGSGTSAIVVGDELWIGTFRGDRIAIIQDRQ